MSNLFAIIERGGASLKRLRSVRGMGVMALCVTLCFIVAWFMPLPEALSSSGPKTTTITDRNGKVLYDVRQGGLQTDISYAKIPLVFIDALVATEDRTFFSHPGVSLRGLTRALVHDIRAMSIVEGGSTVTQQLVRTKLQPTHRGSLYKLHEAWLALKVDATYSKEHILQDFLSSAYFGHQAYGISAAANTYFAKSVDRLSLSETALLVGLINAPSSLNPFKNIEGARKRRDLVLSAMRATGKISEAEERDAKAEPISLSHGKALILAPHFVQWVQRKYPEAMKGTTSVVTTLDIDLQRQAETAVSVQLEKLQDKNVTSAAAVVLDAQNGDVLAMVGSGDFFDDEHDGQVNVAVSPRQPGSAMKPFTYALAFERGKTAASTVADTETRFFTQDGNPYIPRNYDFGYHGLVRYREALANSYNIPAVKVLEFVGVQRLLEFLRRTGITTLTESPEHYGLALTLGDSEVRLLELASSYGVFARGGTTLMPRGLLSDESMHSERVLDAKVAWLISDILSDNTARVPEFGDDGPLEFDFPVAAKTGTTRNSRDNWAVGYTPSRIVGVWVGNADNTPMKDTSGVTGAGPIFHDVMLAASRGVATPFQRPSGTTDVTVCSLSGKLPTPLCRTTRSEHFVTGTEPKVLDDMYQNFLIDTRNGLLGLPTCDEKFLTAKVFPVFPLELQKWARDNGWPQAPKAISPLCPKEAGLPTTSASLAITMPDDHASFLLDPLIPDESEKVILEARASETIESVEWLVDGTVVGTAQAPDFKFLWKPIPGKHTIQARSGAESSFIGIEVLKNR